MVSAKKSAASKTKKATAKPAKGSTAGKKKSPPEDFEMDSPTDTVKAKNIAKKLNVMLKAFKGKGKPGVKG